MNFKILKIDDRYEIVQMLEYSSDIFLDETRGKQYGAKFSLKFETLKELFHNAFGVNYYSFTGTQHRIKCSEIILDFTCDSWELIKETIENKYPEILI